MKATIIADNAPISADTIKTIGKDLPEVITEFVNDPETGNAVSASIDNVKTEIQYAAGELGIF